MNKLETPVAVNEFDTEFDKLSPEDKKLVEELGKEWGEELIEEKKSDFNLLDFLAQAPRKLKRQLQPEKKYGNQLLARLKQK